jgi:hypothetical protein
VQNLCEISRTLFTWLNREVIHDRTSEVFAFGSNQKFFPDTTKPSRVFAFYKDATFYSQMYVLFDDTISNLVYIAEW